MERPEQNRIAFHPRGKEEKRLDSLLPTTARRGRRPRSSEGPDRREESLAISAARAQDGEIGARIPMFLWL